MNGVSLCVLLVLTVNTSVTVLLLRATRTRAKDPDHAYLPSTAVFLAEVCKFAVCAASLVWAKGFRFGARTFRDEIVLKPHETLKLVIPGGLYALQNNLLYQALTYLDAATYQVTYQLKILTTALFSVFLLQKVLTTKQWGSLFILTLGVTLVQLPSATDSDSSSSSMAAAATVTPAQRLWGIACVLCACVSSGASGVYFEKLVKKSQQPSVIIRNLQLSVLSLPLTLSAVLFQDLGAIREKGFTQGYDHLTVILILLQAFGGLLVAIVVKYADNILKGFATSISILICSACSYLFLDDVRPGAFYFVGTALVIGATVLYSVAEQRQQQSRPREGPFRV